MPNRMPAGRRGKRRNSGREGWQEMLCNWSLKAAAMQARSRTGDPGQPTPRLPFMLCTKELLCALQYFVAAHSHLPDSRSSVFLSQLSVDEVVYLSNEESGLGNGFRLQIMADPNLSQPSLLMVRALLDSAAHSPCLTWACAASACAHPSMTSRVAPHGFALGCDQQAVQ